MSRPAAARPLSRGTARSGCWDLPRCEKQPGLATSATVSSPTSSGRLHPLEQIARAVRIAACPCAAALTATPWRFTLLCVSVWV